MRWRVPCGVFLAGLMAAVAAGCGDAGPKLSSVSGAVTVDGVPLGKGGVRFVPYKEKGNDAKVEPVGTLATDGTYILSTASKPGAPLGWYRVTVSGQGDEIPDSANIKAIKKTVASKYADATTSGFLVEVVPAPKAGAYDFKVSAK